MPPAPSHSMCQTPHKISQYPLSAFIWQSYEKELPPGGTINKTPEEFYTNLKRIKEMEKAYNATLIFGHDYDQFQAWAAKDWID